MLTPCAGNVDHADALARHVAAQLDLDVAGFETLRFHWLRRDTFLDLFRRFDDAGGVAR